MRLLPALIPLVPCHGALASPAFAAGSMQITGHGEITAAPDTRLRHLRRHLAGHDRPGGARRQYRRHDRN